MKLEIYKSEKVEKEEPVRLKLVQYKNGNVIVWAVDKNGQRIEQGHLITFQNDGTIYRNYCVNPDFGFQLNSVGQIILEED